MTTNLLLLSKRVCRSYSDPFVLDVAKGASTGDVVLDVTAIDAAGKSLESTDAVIGQISLIMM